MLNWHISTVAQNGQINHWLYRLYSETRGLQSITTPLDAAKSYTLVL